MQAAAIVEKVSAEILIVDDNPANLETLSAMLRDQAYRVRVAPSGAFALQTIKHNVPDVIMLNVKMPDMDGYELCKRLKASEEWESIPVIFISAVTKLFDKFRIFQAGGVDYITKPFLRAEVKARIDTQIRLQQYRKRLEVTVGEKVQETEKAISALIFALTKMVESYDDETAHHLERVQKICRLLAKELQTSSCYGADIDDEFVNNIYRSSVLHDIGKVGIADTILRKPGKLTAQEFEIVKTHTAIGTKMLKALCCYYPKNSFIHMGLSIVQYHHEKWDGSGYPEGLAGEAIPLAARIMTVADVYDAMRSKRHYKPEYSHEQAWQAIIQGTGTQFDPVIVGVFRGLEEQMVRLYTEQPAALIELNDQ